MKPEPCHQCKKPVHTVVVANEPTPLAINATRAPLGTVEILEPVNYLAVIHTSPSPGLYTPHTCREA